MYLKINIPDIRLIPLDHHTYADNFEFNINSGRAFSKLQNDTLFMEIDQCNQVLTILPHKVKRQYVHI